MTDLLALASRVEQEPPSRELDVEIALATGWRLEKKYLPGAPWIAPDGMFDWAPRWVTFSIDAAVTLVPKGCAWELRRGIDFTSSATVYGHDIHEDTDASSLAGALTAACLRARAALAKETTDG